MATKNIVPNADSEGGIGTSSKYWATGFIDAITTTGNLVIGGSIVSTGKITADAGIDIDNINIDGTTIALSSGHLTLDLAAQLIIDSDDDGSITLKNSGTSYGLISSDNTAGDFKFKSVIQDKDIVFQGNDGGTGFTALTIDMSAGGNITMPRAYNDTSSTVLYVDSTITGGASTYQGSLLLQAGGDGSASYGAGFRLYGHVHASKPGSAEVGLSATDGAKFTINNYGAGGGNELFKVERDNGNATVSLGNLVIGTAGKGIDFSAQTPTSVGGADNVAEVLDHYEEGTWTPAIEGQGAAGNWTYAYRTGEYTRIGNQVHISSHIRATVASGANATGSCHINNLPFTSENTNNHNTGVQPAAGYASHVYLTVSPNTNNILVGRMDQSGITTALAEAQFNASNGLSRSEFQMAFDFTYTVPT